MRGHWSVENRNHHKRDASAGQEDRHRHRKPTAALNRALTRNVLLALIPGATRPTPSDSSSKLTPFYDPASQTPCRPHSKT